MSKPDLTLRSIAMFTRDNFLFVAEEYRAVNEEKIAADPEGTQGVIAAALDAAAKSVLQPWVMALPRRHQGTLLTIVRSCDLARKDPACIDEKHGCSTGESTPERALTAFLRWTFMVPHDTREVDVPGAFFSSAPPGGWRPSQFGHYPLHWYSHVMHAFEVVGYCHPDRAVRFLCEGIYKRLAVSLHLNPETREQMEERLTEDRIASGTVAT